MARGKHAASVNNDLRHKLADYERQINQQQRTIDQYEHDVADLQRRLDEIETAYHPAIVAERKRAEHFAAEKRAAVESEAHAWRSLAEEVLPSVRALIRNVPPDAPVFSKESMDDMVALFGSTVFDDLPDSNRDARRARRTAAEARRTLALTDPDNGEFNTRSHELVTPKDRAQRLVHQMAASRVAKTQRTLAEIRERQRQEAERGNEANDDAEA